MTRVGEFEIASLVDTRAVFPLGVMFPNVEPPEWDEFRELYRDTFDGDEGWCSPFGSYLVRATALTLLVDTGVGPGPLATLGAARGRLPTELERANVALADVDVVVHTHGHVDHVGWNVSEGLPRFPNARHVVSRTERDSLSSDETGLVEQQILPLERAGVLEVVDLPCEIARGVTAIATPGHTDGHIGVRVDSGGETALLLGDVALHPAQLANPHWVSSPDEDEERAAVTRRDVLAALDEATLVGCSHFPSPGLGRVRGGRWTRLSA